MTKQEYLEALNEKLRMYDEDFRRDILDAFEGHFQEGLESGHTEDEIIDSLGTVDEVVENIRMMSGFERSTSDSVDDLKKSVSTLIRSVADLVSTGVREAAEAERRTRFPRETPTAEDKTGTIPGPVHTVLIRSSGPNHDIAVEPGNALEYVFRQRNSLFSRRQAVLRTGTDEGIAVFEIQDGSAQLNLKIPPYVNVFHCDMRGGDFYMEDCVFENTNVKNSSGDIELDRIKSGDFSASSASGDIRAVECNLISAYCDTASGDIRFKACEGYVNARSASGDVEIINHGGKKVQAKSVSGDVEISGDVESAAADTTSGDIEFRSAIQIGLVRLNSLSGDIDVELDVPDYNATLATISGDVDIDLDDDVHIDMQSRTIFTVGEGNGVLYVNTKSGDISVN
ncbi:MAG: DUF4097 family beta strand repeat-containing protein [Solobacterium sp.]|nr:DUF4097 family beta strand repeat-containing protein [Solobacterium sp.]